MKLHSGQLIKIPSGGLAGSTVILLHHFENQGPVIPEHQIWTVYIVQTPCLHWSPGEQIGIRSRDLCKPEIS